MKKLEFKTSKGEFILEEASDKNLGRVLVKHMTEEQFEEVVKCSWEHNLKQYSRFTNYLNNDNSYYGSFPTAKESFESLIKSLGWYLFENPNDKQCGTIEWQEAESKTLYNPIILKKV